MTTSKRSKDATNHKVRQLSCDEIDMVSGGRTKAIIVLGDCTTGPHVGPGGLGFPVIIYNPWISPGSPERAGTGTSF